MPRPRRLGSQAHSQRSDSNIAVAAKKHKSRSDIRDHEPMLFASLEDYTSPALSTTIAPLIEGNARLWSVGPPEARPDEAPGWTSTLKACWERSWLQLPVSVLRACPLADTFTILIILLSLPPTLVTVVNTLFAALTFLPSASALFPSYDLIAGLGTTPSLASIVISDLVGLGIWLLVWTPLRSLSGDYTQAVIAAALGGGAGEPTATRDVTILCLGIITGHRVVKESWTTGAPESPRWDAVASIATSAKNEAERRNGWYWIRVLVGLHILVQCVVQWTRQSLAQRSAPQEPGSARRQQPLWAAFAATKLAVLCDYDRNEPVPVSRPRVLNLQPDRFLLMTELRELCTVRLNGADWLQVDIMVDQGSILVHDLEPMTTYHCTMLQGDAVLSEITLTTPSAHKPLPTKKKRAKPAVLLSSPAAKLEMSAAAREQAIGDLLFHQKRQRKEAKGANAMLRKEIDVLTAKDTKLQYDEKAAQTRHLQLTQQIRLTDDAAEALVEELEFASTEAAEDIATKQQERRTWEEARNRHAEARQELNFAKAELQKDVANAQQELAATQQKQERSLARRSRLEEQCAQLTAEFEAEDEAHSNGSSPPASKAQKGEHEAAEQEFQQQMIDLHQAWQQSRAMHQDYLAQIQDLEIGSSAKRPVTPEGTLPGERSFD